MTSLNSSSQGLSDLNMTPEELNRIESALKKPEFRKLLAEYAEEISNPENRKKYEEDIAAMEREQGRDVQFIHPHGAWVLKTVDKKSKAKVFVNIASNDMIEKPTGSRATNGTSSGFNWQIPHSLAPPRDDVDKKMNKCRVVDAVFHPDTIRMAESNKKFRDMINGIALDAIGKNFDFDFDKEKLKSPQSMKYKGRPQAAMVRKAETKPDSSSSTSQEKSIGEKNLVESKVKSIVDEVKQQEKSKRKLGTVSQNVMEKENESTTPKKKQPDYKIVYSKNADIQDFVLDHGLANNTSRPNQIRVTIDLPGIESVAELQLDVFERNVHLENDQLLLDLPLSYPVDQANASAKFDKKRHSLCITVPVLPERVEIQEKNVEIVELPDEEEAKSQSAQNDDSLSENQEISQPEESTTVEATSTSPPQSSPQEISFESDLVKCHPDIIKSAETVACIELLICGRVIDFDTVSSEIAEDGNSFTLRFSSRGQGGFPIFYQLMVRAPESEEAVNTASMMRCFSTYGVFPQRDAAIGGRIRAVLMKEKPQIWNQCLCGIDSSNLKPLTLELDDSITPVSLEENSMRIISVTSCSSPDAPCRLAAIADVADSDDDFNIHAVESISSPRRSLAPRQVTFDVGAVDGDNAENDEGVFILGGSLSSDCLEEFLGAEDYDDDDDAIAKAAVVFNSTPDTTIPSILKSTSSNENICDDSSQCEGFSRRRKSVSFSDKVDNVPFHKSEPAAAIFRTLKNRRRRERRRSACSVSPRDGNGTSTENHPSGGRRTNRRRTLSAGSLNSNSGSGSCSPSSSPSDDISLSFSLSASDAIEDPSVPQSFTENELKKDGHQQKSKSANEDDEAVEKKPLLIEDLPSSPSVASEKAATVESKLSSTPQNEDAVPSFRPETVLSWETDKKLPSSTQSEASSRRLPFELSNSLMYELDASG